MSLLNLHISQHDMNYKTVTRTEPVDISTSALWSTSALFKDYNGFGLRYNYL